MRIGNLAMTEALQDFKSLQYPTTVAAAYEAFLSAKWVTANTADKRTDFNAINQAVTELFTVFPEDDLGRIAPFRYDWRQVTNTGRKTVWNNNSRGGTKKSLDLFIERHIENGLVPDSAKILAALLKEKKPSWQSLAALTLRDHPFNPNDDWSAAETSLQSYLNLSPDELRAITSDTSLGVPLIGPEEWERDTIPEDLAPPSTVIVGAIQTTPGTTPHNTHQPSAVPKATVSVDSRVERMLKTAIATTSSILLVGPPGTGKGTLLKWVIEQVQKSPADFGFDRSFDPTPLWRTPDEGWTSFDLIGGLAPSTDGKNLSWTNGALLNAIEENSWLILDETNRGDMDRIMGPLLTWLSNQDVEIGRSKTHGGDKLVIGWTPKSDSTVESSDDETRYLAGESFRLIGTYNPQDAQRVFRFGQALSRRFVVVPVPAVKPGQFTDLLEKSYPTLPSEAAELLTGLYSAHFSTEYTKLGPAVFLRMASYLIEALASAPSGTAGTGQNNASWQNVIDELIAEAYVMGVGRYLASFDDRTFEELGARVINDENALTQTQWSWVTTQREILS